jgi:PPOX class probable F420-dependent enzyme
VAVGLPERARKLLEGRNFAHLATVMPDGSPQVTPVWVHVEGDDVIVNTSEERVKTRNVRRDPRVALSVYDQKNPYRKATIRGRVIELVHEGADKSINTLSMKYEGEPFSKPEGQVPVILRIRPDRVTD